MASGIVFLNRECLLQAPVLLLVDGGSNLEFLVGCVFVDIRYGTRDPNKPAKRTERTPLGATDAGRQVALDRDGRRVHFRDGNEFCPVLDLPARIGRGIATEQNVTLRASLAVLIVRPGIHLGQFHRSAQIYFVDAADDAVAKDRAIVRSKLSVVQHRRWLVVRARPCADLPNCDQLVS